MEGHGSVSRKISETILDNFIEQTIKNWKNIARTRVTVRTITIVRTINFQSFGNPEFER